MIVYDRDPDVVRWGLDTLMDICTLSTGGSCSSVTEYQTEPCLGYIREGYTGIIIEDVENDALIAHALQDEFSRIAAAEASGLHNPVQESILAQEWHGDHGIHCGSEQDCDQSIADHHSEIKIDAVDSSEKDDGDSSKTKNEESDEKSLHLEELLYSLDIADESALDGEVGKRLNQMVPVPHVPKINGEIPSEDDEISDHQRLLDRLKLYDLVENKVQGDGNCQFRSLSDQLYRSSEHHKFVRQQVINQLKSYPQMYEGYVPMAYGDYLKKMSKTGEWGDHVTLQAAADSYGVKIFVLTSFKDTCYIEILPHVQKSERVICLSFWAEVHYNSIYPEGEVQTKKKKKWWML